MAVDMHNILYSPNAANIQVVVNAEELRKCFENFTKWGMQRIKESREPEYYSQKELAEKLHVTEQTVINYRKKGLLPQPVSIDGKTLLFDKAQVLDCLKAGKVMIRRTYKR